MKTWMIGLLSFLYIGQIFASNRDSTTATFDFRNYTLTVVSGHGIPTPTVGTHTYAWRSAVTCFVENAVTEQGFKWHNTGWSGTGSVPVSGKTNTMGEIILTNLESFITWEWAPSFSATFVDAMVDSRDYTLLVASDHGNPVPGVGTHAYAWRETVNCSVEGSVTSGLTNWTSAGWSGSGSVPIQGETTNTGDIILTGLVSSITWNWDTNYWMENLVVGSGSVVPESGWQRAGSSVQVRATASPDWLFMGWSGDASGDYSQESVIVPMAQSVSVTATFSDDADNDGLLNKNETVIGTNPRKKDTDDDGSNDPDELVAGTSPTNSLSVLAVDFSQEDVANELSWFGVRGRYYQLEQTDELGGTWTPIGTVVEGEDAVINKLDFSGNEKRFYRVRVSEDSADFD